MKVATCQTWMGVRFTFIGRRIGVRVIFFCIALGREVLIEQASSYAQVIEVILHAACAGSGALQYHSASKRAT